LELFEACFLAESLAAAPLAVLLVEDFLLLLFLATFLVDLAFDLLSYWVFLAGMSYFSVYLIIFISQFDYNVNFLSV